MSTRIDIPSLRTARLVLRAFRAADHDAYAAMEARESVRRYRGGNTYDRDQAWNAMQMLLGQWALRGYGVFAVERVADSMFVGFAGILHPPDWPEPELAYSLDAPFWGQGIATEAAVAARNWAFATRQFPRLVSFIMPANTASQQVAIRVGAVRHDRLLLRGIVADRWVHPIPGTGVVV